TTVREAINRPLYRGEVVWNRTRKRDRWGVQKTTSRPAGEWLRQHVPALQIVSDNLWRTVHERLNGVRRRITVRPGGHARDVESHHLLPGFARCAVCGGTLARMARHHRRAKRRPLS